MASFSEANFVKKLEELNNSQQSIQTLSLWLIHHRKHSRAITDVWIKNLKIAKGGKKLTFLYLANDVLQNSKKKGPEFNKDFRTVLPEAYHSTLKDADEKTKGSVERMLNIWVERGVFEKEFIAQLKKNKKGGKPEEAAAPKKTESAPKKAELAHKKTESAPKKSESSTKKSEPPKKKKKVELSLREEIELEMQSDRGETPSAEELIRALNDLEHSASSDATVRENIASLPPEVSDVSLLEKLTDTAEADALAKTVDEACDLLTNYNARLSEELIERKRVAKMLRNFITSQREAIVESEKRYQEYNSKLEKVDAVYKELQSHVQSLPDLSLLPDVTGGLAPLPSAGDLFSLG